MQFVLIAHDKPGGLPLRLSTRPAHLAFIAAEIGPNMLYSGPMLDQDGNPKGSVMIIEAADAAAANAIFAKDPYAVAGLFAETSLSGFKTVFRSGEMVPG